MMLSFCFTGPRPDSGEKKGTICLPCLVYVRVFMGATETEQSNKQCDVVVRLSLELQQTECALTHDVNDLYIMADRGHVLVIHSLISSISHTPKQMHSVPSLQ